MEQPKTAVAQIKVMSSRVSYRWSFEKFRLWQVMASVEYGVAQDEVSAKPATLERKDIRSTKSVLIWQIPHDFDHTSGQVLLNTIVEHSFIDTKTTIAPEEDELLH